MVDIVYLVFIGYHQSPEGYRMEVDMDNSLLGVSGCGSNSILLLRQTEKHATTAGFSKVTEKGFLTFKPSPWTRFEC
ncbi:MAG: hypothetical protein Q8P70_00710 [bacterium]|nr:hypothetical protein [bacterium]